ncbi:RNA polymerase sigma factor [Herbaspirillum sp. SJZ107]|uniref:RNA polymerase sigma factor n=1 Tax=Herbaspirillum sp. SJZ107 TaxID=2572881 RepID=UPI001151E92A|nr:RNA polymerase sigma factor [Herbaspirillum sp. SJZ107]TQK08135.1 RNA polymerase ECF family sigma subunit [Herbaspirillum sp. SJZ107]
MSEAAAGHGVGRTVEAVWRMESAHIVGALTRMLRDVGLAEELAQDAMLQALESWPADGLPDRPGAWLMQVAKHRALDHLRHQSMRAGKEGELSWEFDEQLRAGQRQPDELAELAQEARGGIADDVLRLIFVACHPVLSAEARAALTLKLVGGLSTLEIGRAFLVPEATVAQRIVRAKRTLGAAQVPFEVPSGLERKPRLASVLQVIYLIYNEGYAASAGADWLRPALCREALRLGRVLAELMPAEGEVHGLVALMEIQSSRERARTGPDGAPILLLEQDRTRWDRLLIRRGLDALERAAGCGSLGPYALQAAIAACHARALSPEATDWVRITALYDALAQLLPSPVVELNRAVAVGMAYGPAEGLALADALLAEPMLRHYHLLPSVRGDLLAKLGRHEEARAEFRRAAGMTRNERERALLLARAS